MLPGILAASAEANTIIRRGPGQQPEPITGELTIAIRRPAAGDDLADNSPAGAGLPITMARTAPVVPHPSIESSEHLGRVAVGKRQQPPRSGADLRSSLAGRATLIVSAVHAYLAAQMRSEVGNGVHWPGEPSARSLVSPMQPVTRGRILEER